MSENRIQIDKTTSQPEQRPDTGVQETSPLLTEKADSLVPTHPDAGCFSPQDHAEATRQAAREYLKKGWAVAPIRFRSKEPGGAHPKSIKVTADDLEVHFPPGQPRNIVVLNGAASNNLVDVDLDCPEAIIAAKMLLPDTGCVFGRPSSLASHWLYQTPIPLETAQEKYADLDGSMLVEMRGSGGYTVIPPSIHDNSGETITWLKNSLPAQISLNDLRYRVKLVAAVALLARHWVQQGTRQEAYMALAGGLLQCGIETTLVELFIKALAVATNDEEKDKRIKVVEATDQKQDEGFSTTGWPRLAQLLGKDGEEVVNRLRQWLGRPRTQIQERMPLNATGPFVPFPLSALPVTLRKFAMETAENIGCAVEFVILPVLAVIAACIGNTRKILLKDGWDEPSILWALIIGDSGTHKSPAFKAATEHLDTIQNHWHKQFQIAEAKYDCDKRQYDRQTKKTSSTEQEPPVRPVLTRILVRDTTIEKLIEILSQNPRGLLLARDEMSAWFGSFARYKSGANDLPQWLEMHSAGSISYDRKSSTTMMISHASVSIVGGIQPEILSRLLSPEFLSSGLIARLLLVMPPKTVKPWSNMIVAPETKKAYKDLIDKLLTLSFDPDMKPQSLLLSAEATKAWSSFFNDVAKQQSAAEGEIAAMLSKLVGYAARFVLLHHVVKHVEQGGNDLVPVSKESIDAGIAICNWFNAEGRRVYSILQMKRPMLEQFRLLEWIRKQGGKTTVRALQQSNGDRYPSAEHARQALQSLVDTGIGFWSSLQTTSCGGRPTEVFVLKSDDRGSSGEVPEPDSGQLSVQPASSPPIPHHDLSQHLEVVSGVGSQDCSVAVEHSIRNEDLSGVECSAHPIEIMPDVPAVVSGKPTKEVTVRDTSQLAGLISAVRQAEHVALYLPMPGNPSQDKPQSFWLCCEVTGSEQVIYRMECSSIELAPLWTALKQWSIIVHDAVKTLGQLRCLGYHAVKTVHDTLLFSQILSTDRNQRWNLNDCCRQWLRDIQSKNGQQSIPVILRTRKTHLNSGLEC